MSLQLMRLSDLTSAWRPGSHDLDWTWLNEIDDLFTRDFDRTMGVWERVKEEGISYGSEYGADICLGNDGRVWDGHHRIVVGLALGITEALVDVV